MIIPQKTYEKPDSGVYTAVLADIVDLGNVSTVYNGATKIYPAVRFVWYLGTNVTTGTPAVGKDGKQLQTSGRFNVSNLHEKSNIYKTLKQILGTAPDPKLDIDTLIGSVRQLVISKETKDGKEYANIMGILPAPAGTVVSVPADFVQDRKLPVQQQAKNRQQTQAPAQQAAPVAPAAAPAQNTAALQAQLAALQAQLNAQNGNTQGPDIEL